MDRKEKLMKLLRKAREREKIENKKIYVATSTITKKLSTSRNKVRRYIEFLAKLYKIETIIIMKVEKDKIPRYEYAYRLEKE